MEDHSLITLKLMDDLSSVTWPLPLPLFGEATCQDRRVLYEANSNWKVSAPYGTVNIEDANKDLPRIDYDNDQLEMRYDQEPISHFQREMREGSDNLTSDVPKKMCKVIVERIKLIPPSQDMFALPENMRLCFLTNKPRKGAYGWPSWKGTCTTVITNPNPGGRQGEVVHMTQDR